VGNCWFLSALAVIAERPHLVRQVIPQTQLNDVGIYQVNLCLDGRWMPIIIDTHLLIVQQGKKK
jgi:calpain-15